MQFRINAALGSVNIKLFKIALKNHGSLRAMFLYCFILSVSLWSTGTFGERVSFPRNPISIKLSPLTSAVYRDSEAVFVERWIALFKNLDSENKHTAFQLLVGANPTLLERIRAALIEKNLDLSGLARFDWLMNTSILHQLRLMDKFEYDLARIFEDTIKSTNRDALMVPLMSLRNLSILPPEIARHVISLAQESTQLGDEARSLLLSVPFSTKKLLPELRAWAGDSKEQITRNTIIPWVLMLRSDIEIPLERWIDLLNDDSRGIDAVINALRRNPDLLYSSNDLQIELLKYLQNLRNEHSWYDLFVLISELMPDKAELFYEARRLEPRNAWPIAIDAIFISLADQRHDKWIVDLQLTEADDVCASIRWNLAILERVARVGRSVKKLLQDLWIDTEKCQVGRNWSGPSTDELWDRVLEAALINNESLEGFALPQNAKFIEPVAKTLKIAQLHETSLIHALIESDDVKIQYLLKLGTEIDGQRLKKFDYWNQKYNLDSGSISVADLAALQRARDVPDFVWRKVQSIAFDDSNEFDQRAWALAALTKLPSNKAKRVWLMDLVNKDNFNIARIASSILAEELNNLPSKIDPPDISRDELENFILRDNPNTEDKQSRLLHQRLLRFSDDFMEWYIEMSDREIPCQLLAARLPASPKITRLLMLKAVTSEQRIGIEQMLCISLIGNSEDPSVLFAYSWSQLHQTDPYLLNTAYQKLWADKDVRETLGKELAQRIASNTILLPKNFESQQIITNWKQTIKPNFPEISDQIEIEEIKRFIYVALISIPLALIAHIVIWLIILTLYPRSTSIQAVILWNPWFRKLIGLGYFDIILMAWPFARRQLFAPFHEQLLGDILEQGESEFDRHHYFQGSLIRQRNEGAIEPGSNMRIVDTLPYVRGRVLLLGRSGLGKSSFIRYTLNHTVLQAREVIAYLRADQCKQGVESVIIERCMALGNDQHLIRAMIHSGRLFVFIDGYNEVDSSIQDQITLFLSNFPRGNILVASQIPLRGLTRLKTFEILPLEDNARRDFLLSRVNVLPATSCVQGGLFTRSASAFFDEYVSRRQQNPQLIAMDEAMSNPMDLTTVALLISQAKVPDLYNLEWQHFEVAQHRLEMNGSRFRIEPFSKAVLAQRLMDQEDLEKLEFKPEVIALVECKLAQLRTYADHTGRILVQETRFRHDRLRDFFCHFAIANTPIKEIAVLASDTRIGGVFPFLARSLPEKRASELREILIQMAAEIEDHRVSDAYVRELGRRHQMQINDPKWLEKFDSQETQIAIENLNNLIKTKDELDQKLVEIRRSIEHTRYFTRILLQTDSDQMLIRIKKILELLGASTKVSDGNPNLMTTPKGNHFLLCAVASSQALQTYQIDLALARLGQRVLPVLLVINNEADIDPILRQPIEFVDLPPNVLIRTTIEILTLLSLGNAIEVNSFWQRFEIS